MEVDEPELRRKKKQSRQKPEDKEQRARLATRHKKLREAAIRKRETEHIDTFLLDQGLNVRRSVMLLEASRADL
jgi:hypothetical protein